MDAHTRLVFAVAVVAAVATSGCASFMGLEALEVPDRDRDGIFDADDNCADTVNVDQLDTDRDGLGDACDPCVVDDESHDEDGDGIADRCDNCPVVGNDDQTNSDGDDLGNACDTRGAFECIVLFDGFNELPVDAGRVGTWSAIDGALSQPDSGLKDGLFVLAPQLDVTGIVETTAVVRSVSNAPGVHNVGVWRGIVAGELRPGVPTGMISELGTSDPQPTATVLFGFESPSGTNPPAIYLAPTTSLKAGTRGHLEQWLVSSPQTFSARAEIGDASATHTWMSQQPHTQGRIGLRTFQLGAEFDYIVATQVRASGPCPAR